MRKPHKVDGDKKQHDERRASNKRVAMVVSGRLFIRGFHLYEFE